MSTRNLGPSGGGRRPGLPVRSFVPAEAMEAVYALVPELERATAPTIEIIARITYPYIVREFVRRIPQFPNCGEPPQPRLLRLPHPDGGVTFIREDVLLAAVGVKPMPNACEFVAKLAEDQTAYVEGYIVVNGVRSTRPYVVLPVGRSIGRAHNIAAFLTNALQEPIDDTTV